MPKFAYVTSARGGQSKYLNGEKVYYSCQAGYELVGIPQIECENGVWTEHSFSCKGKVKTHLVQTAKQNTMQM